MDKKSRFLGCLLGGAAGDALGYPVEFIGEPAIRNRFGPAGIGRLDQAGQPALISDDTQMTLFTANALLFAETHRRIGAPGGTMEGATTACYRDWLRTQEESYPLPDRDHTAWLVHVPELFHRRAPGNTCLNAVAQGASGTVERPINPSKGCGGIMRVAPIGLHAARPEGAGLLAVRNAAMTHGHELGYLPSGVLGYCVSALAHEENTSVFSAVQRGMEWVARQFPDAAHLPELTALVERAIRLSHRNLSDDQAIRELGEGWVAEETLAIAVYCALKYEHDFDRALIAAVNHDGDSDSTGAVTGNLLGARLGLAQIPQKYLEHLELKEVTLELADDLYYGCPPAYGREPLVHVVGTPLPETPKENAEAARWDEKYNTASYCPTTIK